MLGTLIASKDCKLQQKYVNNGTLLVAMTMVVLVNVIGCHDNSGLVNVIGSHDNSGLVNVIGSHDNGSTGECHWLP